jgi:hypothetical protein
MTRAIVRSVWVLVALVAAYGGYAGGDAAIALGWLFLVWTAPFGIVWWVYIYPVVLSMAPKATLELVGPALAIVLAYWFWFMLLPAVFRWARSKSLGAKHAL